MKSQNYGFTVPRFWTELFKNDLLPTKKEVVKLVIIHSNIYKQTTVVVLSVYIQKEVVNIQLPGDLQYSGGISIL